MAGKAGLNAMRFTNVLTRNPSVEVLEQAFEAGKIHHAYLLTGPEGCGKFACALEFATALLCRNPKKAPCHDCPSCRKIKEYAHPDFRVVFPFVSDASFEAVAKELGLREQFEKKSHDKFTLDQLYRLYHFESAKALVQSPFARPKVTEELSDKNREIFVSNLRELIGGDRERPNETGFLELPPSEGAYKVVVILEAEKMASAAANAFLKTLEEPPSYAKLFLVSSRPSQLLPTVRSRCQRLAFGPLDEPGLRDFLTNQMHVDGKTSAEAARGASGSVQAALDLANPDLAGLRDEAKEFAAWFAERDIRAGLAMATRFAESSFAESQRRLLFAAAYLREARGDDPSIHDALQKLATLHDALGRKANPRLAHSAFMLSF